MLVVPTPTRVGKRARVARPARLRARAVAVSGGAASDRLPTTSRPSAVHASRRDALLGASATVLGLAATTIGFPSTAHAVEPPPTPDASTSKYIQNLLAKTEANKDVRAVELQNKNCLRQSRLGVGDCAGLSEEELVKAMDESVKKLQAKKVKEAEERRILAAQVEAYENGSYGYPGEKTDAKTDAETDDALR